MPYRLAIFDFDGTLADSFPFFFSVFNEVAARHRFRPVEAEMIPELRRLDARELMRRLEVPGWKLPMVAASFTALMGRDLDQVPCFDGVDALLAGLQAGGVQLAVVSSNAVDNVARVLGAHNMARLAACECGMSVFGKAGRLRRVLRDTGVAADEAIYIGDQPTDHEAAKAVGMAFGAVAWGYGDVARLAASAPERVFHAVADIAAIAPGSGLST